ncbi:MAG TPA: hypothetical protein H9870_07660 [Candidatus Corynebacterium avicola]|uniref:Uncharacterized protein n=1 Tax=Candidatus Corynebacterium avicola TaxID=2838527 RepID=A0A9D1RP30_9CORY|nr:hypothetical protein [Candidatus Corynebacterium avicola]
MTTNKLARFTDEESLTGSDGKPALLGHRKARAGSLRDAYPSGTHDEELGFAGRPDPTDVARYTHDLLEQNPRCRRVVLPVPEQDLDAIAWAEESGYRYVIDVETIDGDFSLLVTEPQWVLDQPVILDEIPLKDTTDSKDSKDSKE